MKPLRRLRTLTLVLAAVLCLVLAVIVVDFLVQPWTLAVLAAVTALVAIVSQVARRDIPSHTVLEVDLDGGIVEAVSEDPIGRALAFGSSVLRDVVDAIDRAANDPRVEGLIARLGTGEIGIAQAQEVRDAVLRFSGQGKRTVAFAETFGEGALATVPYYLATAFQEIHLQPAGELNVGGLITRSPFLKGLAERLGVIPDLDHRREYKAAMYLITEDHFTEPHAEAAMSVMDSQLEDMVSGIAAARGLRPEEVRALIDRAPLVPTEALGSRLVDALSYRDEAFAAAKGDHGRLLFLDQYLKRAGRPNRRGESIALIYGVGGTQRGRPRFDPLSRSSSMGSDTVGEAFRAAVATKATKAIVFRVDSPGGSAVASEAVRRETVRAREAGKPVVVSMGNVAGSGGYWISASADRIVAQPGTVTGSIGVVAGKLVTRQAWQRIGVSWDELHLGENATFASPDRRYTAAERDRFQSYLDSVYGEFKSLVGEGRSLNHEAVEAIAKGRIWSGREAQRLGLVDELGGLDRAVAIAKQLADIPAERPVKLTAFPRRRTLPLKRRRESSEATALIASIVGLLKSRSSRVVEVP